MTTPSGQSTLQRTQYLKKVLLECERLQLEFPKDWEDRFVQEELLALIFAAKQLLSLQSSTKAIKRLAKGILTEAINDGWADLWDEQYNPDAQINITLKLSEVRCAAKIMDFHPTKAQLLKAKEAHDWAEYIQELDGVE